MALSNLSDADLVQTLMSGLENGENNVRRLVENALREHVRTASFFKDNEVRIPDVFDADAQAELTTRLGKLDTAIDALFATGLMPKTREEMEVEVADRPGPPMP